jgi:hypothetical protein
MQHCSGLLKPFAERGAAVASAYSFESDPPHTVLVEGTAPAVRTLRRLFKTAPTQVLRTTAARKNVYAAAVACCSTYVLPLLATAADCFRHAGLAPAKADLLMARLLTGSVRSYLRAGRKLLSGASPSLQELDRQLEALRAEQPALANQFQRIVAHWKEPD